MNNHFKQDKIRAFWNKRAGMGLAAGSQDIILKELEMNAIAAFVKPGMSVLDVGCGNGVTVMEIARRFPVRVYGIDIAEQMVTAAENAAKKTTEKFAGSVSFAVGDITQIQRDIGTYDVVYTERTLINLQDFEAQKHALDQIARTVAPGGIYVMCESSKHGLQQMNSLRKQIGLPKIQMPWHNCYIDDKRIMDISVQGLTLDRVEDFSSTYYFLSRIVNAHLAHLRGEEPKYDDAINTLALSLPPLIDGFGQTKIWVWKSSV